MNPQVKHSYEGIIDDSGLVQEQNMAAVLQQFMQAMFDHVAILVTLQFHQNQFDELGIAEDWWLLSFNQPIKGRPYVLDKMNPVATKNVEQVYKGFGALMVLIIQFGYLFEDVDGEKVRISFILSFEHQQALDMASKQLWSK